MTVFVDPSNTSEILVNSNNGPISITVNPGGRLSVENNLGTEINFSTSIYLYLLEAPNNLTCVYLPAGIIHAGLPEHKISKDGQIRIY